MNKITLRNTITGEEKIILNQGNFKAPWVVKSVEHVRVPGEVNPRTDESIRRDARLAVLAAQQGLPVAEFLQAAMWLLRKNCSFCQAGQQVLKTIDKLGEHVAMAVLSKILDAKDRNDLETLNAIRKELWSSDSHGSPPQS